MQLETILYVSVLTGPARTREGVAEFTGVLRRQMSALGITGAFTTCDNLGVHIAQGETASIDRLMSAVEVGFWQAKTQVLNRMTIQTRDFHRWDLLDARLFGAEVDWLREQLAQAAPPADPIRALLIWAASRQIEREAEDFTGVLGSQARSAILNRLH
jgi:hypothetical protein